MNSFNLLKRAAKLLRRVIRHTVVALLVIFSFCFTGCKPKVEPMELTADQQVALAKIAVEGGGSYYAREREAAVEKLTDQVLLAKIAVEAKYYSVQKAAVEKLTDQALLAEIALEDKAYDTFVSFPIGRYAIEKLTDQVLLAKIAAESKESYVRFAAINKLTDQAMLAKLGIAEKDAECCKKVIERLDDQELLAKVVIKAINKDMREVAFTKLKTADQGLLVKIAMESVDEKIRWAAYYRLRKLNDFPAGLTQLSMTADDQNIRLDASLLLKIHSAFQSCPEDVGIDWRLRNILFEAVCILVNLDVNTELGDLENIQINYKSLISEEYAGGPVKGETITLSAKLGKMDQPVIHCWSTDFPFIVNFQKGTSPFVEAEVNVADFFQDICGFLSEAALGKVALESGHPDAQLVAVRKLTDKAVLHKILTAQETSSRVKEEARKKLAEIQASP